jgi:hypothetical protein
MKTKLEKLAGNFVIVVLLGLVSTTTAWAAIQSSLHAGKASDASSEYALALAAADNAWITAEVKYRDDLSVLRDKQVRHFIDKVPTEKLYDDIRTSNGSYEFYVDAFNCFTENPRMQLADCKPYMESIYGEYEAKFASSKSWIEVSNTETSLSNQLQMLTGLFAVSLFLLGITAVMRIRNLVAYLVVLSIILWIVGTAVLLSTPMIFA